MPGLDLTPLFRSTIGFDRFNHLFDAAFNLDDGVLSYPPYNIEKWADDHYRITMAVAGFDEEELKVTFQENLLTISGKRKETEGDKKVEYFYRGIATRAFERRFQLADNVKVTGAELANGLLRVDLDIELPEAMKPRRVEIRRVPEREAKVIEGKAA